MLRVRCEEGPFLSWLSSFREHDDDTEPAILFFQEDRLSQHKSVGKTDPVYARVPISATASQQINAFTSTRVYFDNVEELNEGSVKEKSRSIPFMRLQLPAISQGRTPTLPSCRRSLTPEPSPISAELELKLPHRCRRRQSKQSDFQNAIHDDSLISTDCVCQQEYYLFI